MSDEVPASPVAERRWFSSAYILPIISVLVLAGTLGYAIGQFVAQPDTMQQADALLLSGQYYAAFQQYSLLGSAKNNPALGLRLGILRMLRGELPEAEQLLWQVVTEELDSQAQALATLYLGHVLASRGQLADAEQVWQQNACAPPTACPYAPYREVMHAEWLLRGGDYDAAATRYRTVLSTTVALPADWHTLAVYRVALLAAATNSDDALAMLDAAAPGQAAPAADPWLTPLLPPDIDRASGQLRAVLAADPVDRPQLLGQLYMQIGYAGLALRQFAQIPNDNPHALVAQIYAAYMRWRMGDRQTGLAQLERLAADHPAAEGMQALRILVTLQDLSLATTEALSTTMAALPSTDPETYLVEAAWYAARSDYLAASRAYQQVLRYAPATERGAYALLVARFYLGTTYELCDEGLPVAEEATRLLSDDPEAWTTLAASLYQCGEFSRAVTAARRAMQRGERADTSFYLGAALARLGEYMEARAHLVRAADLAPASVWRERAEGVLAEFRL